MINIYRLFVTMSFEITSPTFNSERDNIHDTLEQLSVIHKSLGTEFTRQLILVFLQKSKLSRLITVLTDVELSDIEMFKKAMLRRFSTKI